MKKFFLMAFLALSMSVSGLHAQEADKKESIFINVTSSENIKAPMAIMFALKGLERKLDMTILLNVEGVQLAIKGFEAPTNARNGKTTQEMLAMFIQQGGKVLVCPMCLSALGYNKDQLIKGVTVSKADTTFGAILASDKVISY